MALRQSRKRERQLRKVALLTLCDPSPPVQDILGSISKKEWQCLLRWLDTSGLALYFLDRIVDLKQAGAVPGDIIAHLQIRLTENIARANGMFSELTEICAAFTTAGASFAVLKGCSLWPDSIMRLELRSQLDLDFLVAAESACVARRILESRGYHLRAISGHSWEFKTDAPPGWSLKQLYKDGLSRSAEMHIAEGDCNALLERIELRQIRGIKMPVLSPADLIIGQGVHAFKHICSEFSRTAHLVEFRRHVIRRYYDAAFWSEVRSRSQYDRRATVALGVVTLLITQVMGEFAPSTLTQWTVDQLPDRARLWVEMYGEEIVFSSFPGNKLYLILQQELVASGLSIKRGWRRALLPLSLPPLIVHALQGETWQMRLLRHCVQARFILFRLKFHLLAGLQYLRESVRWRIHTNGLAS